MSVFLVVFASESSATREFTLGEGHHDSSSNNNNWLLASTDSDSSNVEMSVVSGFCSTYMINSNLCCGIDA